MVLIQSLLPLLVLTEGAGATPGPGEGEECREGRVSVVGLTYSVLIQ